MNALRNSVRLIGHLGENPKVRKLESGKKVANFSIATNEIYRDSNGEKQSETTWHRLVAWEKQAEIAENYLKKGSEIAVEGKLTNRSYDDKNGEKHYITEVVVNSLLMLDKKNGNG
ncbi:MAG: single-stranded DNA-binding protein [Mariniphaga sp.]|nr:single-stranded DNA-binding protein [Mariniphaga sp.]